MIHFLSSVKSSYHNGSNQSSTYRTIGRRIENDKGKSSPGARQSSTTRRRVIEKRIKSEKVTKQRWNHTQWVRKRASEWRSCGGGISRSQTESQPVDEKKVILKLFPALFYALFNNSFFMANNSQ